MKTVRKHVKLAPRRWRRQFSKAVSGSIFKTLTEPVTNAVDSYKRLKRLEESSGIVDRLLKLGSGSRIEHDEIVKGIQPKKTKCKVSVVLARTKKTKIEKRTVRVIDQAEGMSSDDLDAAVSKYGEEKSKQSEGAAVRGLFGQGISDVLWGHDSGLILGISDDQLSSAKFGWDESGEPEFELTEKGKPTKTLRNGLGIAANGTCVEFRLSEKCSIPSRDQLYEKACSFYMLRLINADPCCEATLEQINAKGSECQTLRYNFPSGSVLKSFSTQVKYESYNPVTVEGIIIRSDQALNAGSDMDEKENGFLVVDEHDTVYDLTLFDFEKMPGLDQVYGVVRLTGFREIAYDRLQNHDDAIITESRDGFDRRNAFTKALWDAIKPLIEDTLKTERKRKIDGDTELSGEMRKRMNKALELLNSLYKEETGEEGGGPGPGGIKLPEFDTVTFVPNEVTLTAGVSRRVLLLAKAEILKKDSYAMVMSKNSDIIIEPEGASFKDAPEVAEGIVALGFRISSTVLGSSGSIEGLIETKDGDTDTCDMWVRDVRVPPELETPADGIEFRPRVASTIPARKGLVVLYVDVSRVPLGSDLQFKLEDAPSGLTLVSDTGAEIVAFSAVLKESDLIEGTRIAKIPVRFKGHGKGQRAKISAKVKVKQGGKYKDDAELRIMDGSESSIGMFKKIEYEPLPDSSKLASQFYAPEGTIYINSTHPTNVGFFGKSKQTFKEQVDGDRGARIRLAQLVLDEAMYHTLAQKQHLTGNRGWKPTPGDLVGSVREQVETWKHDVGAKLFRALVEDFTVSRLT